MCLARPRAGHGRPPPGPPRTALPLRSGRREQLSSGRAKLEGTRADPPAGHPPGGHSPPSRGQKDRAPALCADTSAGEWGGAGQQAAANQRACRRGQDRKESSQPSERLWAGTVGPSIAGTAGPLAAGGRSSTHCHAAGDPVLKHRPPRGASGDPKFFQAAPGQEHSFP